MKLNTTLTTWGLLATMAVGGVAPALADGYRAQSSNQADKNNMRNLTVGAAAVAAYGLFSHNGAATLLGAAGAALAGSQYEKDRKQQSQDNNQYYYRDGRNGNSNYGRNGNNGDSDRANGYSNWNQNSQGRSERNRSQGSTDMDRGWDRGSQTR